jgi:phospholipid/cholesterol/gamma-HCH transport system substrate-binding protein
VDAVKSFRERSPIVVGLVSILLIAVGLGAAFSINKVPALRGVYSIYADLEDAAGLRSGNEVRVAGVKVGQVTGVELTETAARVKMEIANDIILPRSTRLEVKLKTLLGQKFIDLQMPRSLLSARAAGEDPIAQGEGFLENGDVIPLEQTRIPFDIYQAATEGTAVLEEIDKKALRQLLNVLAGTFGRSADELRSALVNLDDVGDVLGSKSIEISRLLKHTEDVTKTLGDSGEDLEGILERSAEVLTTLAENRSSITGLLAATEDLGRDLGTLIQVAKGDIELGFADLNSLLAGAQSELESLEIAIQNLGDAQLLFARPGAIGRFIEGHVCAVTSEDTCVPYSSPQDPGLPVHGIQPTPTPARVLP